MKYEILDKAELDAGVEFYQAYFYGNGERSLLLNHLETWPSHANWLVAEILFFLKTIIKIAAGQTAELGTILETIKYGCTLQLVLMKIIPITMNILKKTIRIELGI